MPCPICHLDHTIESCTNEPAVVWDDLYTMMEPDDESGYDAFNESRMYIENYLSDEMIRALNLSYGQGPPADTRDGYIHRIVRGLFIRRIQYYLLPAPVTESQIRVTLAMRSSDDLADTDTFNPTESCQKECPVCYNDIEQIDTLGCNHDVCHTCIVTLLERKMACPMCRTKIQGVTTQKREHFTVYEQLLSRPQTQQQPPVIPFPSIPIHSDNYTNHSHIPSNTIYYNFSPPISNNIIDHREASQESTSHRYIG